MASRTRPVSWPMYAVDPAAVSRFWADLRAAMLEGGVTGVPGVLNLPGDLLEHWRDPWLLLSHTCGFPFATTLHGSVRYVCTPRFRAEHCEGGRYCSAIVVRDSDTARSIAEFEHRPVAYNGIDSHSGYNALRATVAPHARSGRFFSTAIETTSHRGSLLAVRTGAADLAAIDGVTLALVRRSAPDETRGLRVLCFTETAPGLPLITGQVTDDDQLRRLRKACAAACDPARSAARELLLDGIEIFDEPAYDAIATMQARAETLGYAKLA